MKILMVSSGDFFSTYGGGQIYVKNLVDELIDRGIVISIAVPGEHEPPVSAYRGASVDYYPPSAVRPCSDALVSLLRKIKPDIVHVHGDKAAFSRACHIADIPCLVTAHHGGILCPAGTLLNYCDRICRIRANYRDCLPCVLHTIRGGLLSFRSLRLFSMGLLLSVGRRLRKTVFIPYITPVGTAALSIQEKQDEWRDIIRYATVLISPSEAMAGSMMLNGATEEMIRIVPHGIPLPVENTSPIAMGASSGEPLRFFYVGRISHVKGLHVLLEAFSGVTGDAELHIIGGSGNKTEGRYLQSLKNRYASNSRIVWHGKVDNRMVGALTAEFDVMVHPTICLEVFGLTIAEALAAGKPVISTRCGGAEMQVKDGVNGLLVEPNDAMALAGAMQMVADSKVDICSMSQAAPASVVSLEQHVSLLCDLYHSTAAKP